MATRTASCNCGQLTAVYKGPDPERVSLCQCYECREGKPAEFRAARRA
jgi:hypothetical protein